MNCVSIQLGQRQLGNNFHKHKRGFTFEDITGRSCLIQVCTMWKRIKNSRTAANMEKFRKLRQRLNNWIRLERRNYVKNIADEIHSNSKRFWSYFAFKNKAKPIPDKLTYNNTTCLLYTSPSPRD